jgi:signal peptidase II
MYQHIILFGLALFVIVVDQLTKFWIRATLADYETFAPIPFLANFLTFIHTNNTGAAFGMLKAFGGVFTIIAIVVVAAIVYYYPRLPPNQIGIRVALGLQLGGAIGNLIDRLINDGKVTDWIFFHWFDLLNAPIFNLADLSITCGVIVLALLMWKESNDERKAKAAQPEPAATHE